MFKFEDCLAYLANRNSKLLAAAMDKRMSAIGITRVQWMTLYYISTHADITQKELAALLGTKEPTVVRLLDRMEKDDLLKRNRKDRRTNTLELSEKGKRLHDEGLVIAEKFKDDAIKGIPAEDMDRFLWVLDQMVENTAS